jgi:phenylalanyl-tRNA synthetase alpha chain
MKEILASGTLKAGEKALAELKKRKLMVQKYVELLVNSIHDIHWRSTPHRKGLWYTVTKGPDFSTSTAKPETDLTAEMMTSYVLQLSTR